MNNFDDIQQLWQGSPSVPPPDPAVTIALVKRQKRKMVMKGIGLSLQLLLTFLFILFLWFHYQFKLLSTQIGIMLVLIAVLAAILVNTHLFTILLRTSGSTADNAAYLRSMKRYQQKVKSVYTYGISIYYVLLSLGIMLYMYEFVSYNTWKAIIFYTLVSGWMAFAWFYLRPRTIKKQTETLNNTIEKLEAITKQLDD